MTNESDTILQYFRNNQAAQNLGLVIEVNGTIRPFAIKRGEEELESFYDLATMRLFLLGYSAARGES